MPISTQPAVSGCRFWAPFRFPSKQAPKSATGVSGPASHPMVASEESLMKSPRLGLVRAADNEQASVEFILVMPLLVIILLALLTVGRLLYVHLALITAANDCATSAAQATEFDPMISQGFA